MTAIKNKILTFLNQEVSPAPLAVFRILFAFIMAVSVIRFIANGWIEQFYVEPAFQFKYPYFEWVPYPGDIGIYLLFSIMLISSITLMLGYKYRLSAILFFLSFTFVELIDITYYLNHYYFISLAAFAMIFLPAGKYFSLDAKRDGAVTSIPKWTILIVQIQLGIVYFFAGLAKLNYDWLVEAMPLSIWLPAHSHLPIIGQLMTYDITAYIFSWFGALYDLTIVFFLLYNKTRPFAYFFVVVFHLATAMLFQIGMFPYVMILLTLIFFSEDFHKNLIQKFKNFFNIKDIPITTHSYKARLNKALIYGFAIFTIVQIAIPLRYIIHNGDLFWDEKGYRFSWRVMLMEKAGTVFFTVKDSTSGYSIEVVNSDYLTKDQEKQMSTQPDLILQFARFLEKEYESKGYNDVEVYADSYVTLNGSGSKKFIKENVDLTQISSDTEIYKWLNKNN